VPNSTTRTRPDRVRRLVGDPGLRQSLVGSVQWNLDFIRAVDFSTGVHCRGGNWRSLAWAIYHLKVKCGTQSVRAGAHLPSLGHWSLWRTALHCDARPTVTFPAAGHHRLLTAWWQRHMLVNNSCPRLLHDSVRPVVEPATVESQVQHRNHYTSRSHYHLKNHCPITCKTAISSEMQTHNYKHQRHMDKAIHTNRNPRSYHTNTRKLWKKATNPPSNSVASKKVPCPSPLYIAFNLLSTQEY